MLQDIKTSTIWRRSSRTDVYTFKRAERRREEADLGDWTVFPLPTFLELLFDSAVCSPFSGVDSWLWSVETEATGAESEIIEESWLRYELCKEIPV